MDKRCRQHYKKGVRSALCRLFLQDKRKNKGKGGIFEAMAEIDYVVPMVFPEDVLWQRDFKKCNSSYIDEHVRWRSWGTERQLIRLVRKNMPWVNNIYVLLARKSQLQYWMNDEKVRIVYHKDFIPERLLPLFNSCAIEMFLHKIPGLSECFIYGNDDMFPLAPLMEEDFFVNGKPCQKMTEEQYPEVPNIFEKSCMNGLNFVSKEFGKKFSKTWLKNGHSLAPIRKSTCDHLWKRGEDEIEMSVTSFRCERNFNQYIYAWWQHFAGEYVQKAPLRRYAGINKNSVEDIVWNIRQKDSIVCVNDNSKAEDYKKYAEAVRKELNNALNS